MPAVVRDLPAVQDEDTAHSPRNALVPPLPLDPEIPVTEFEVKLIRELAAMTELPQAAISPGKFHPYKAILLLEPLIRNGDGVYITSSALDFLNDVGVDRFCSSIRLYPHDSIEGAIDYVDKNRRLPKQLRDPRCRGACELLRQSIMRESRAVLDKPVCGVLYGSQYFGDPSLTPDIDFCFVVPDTGTAQDRALVKLRRHMTERIHEAGYESDISVIDLSAAHEAIESIGEGDWELMSRLSCSFPLLSGKLFTFRAARSDGILPLIENFRRELNAAAAVNPLLNLVLCGDLRGIVDIDMGRERPARRRAVLPFK